MDNTKLQENTARWRKTKRGLITNLYSKMKSRNEVLFDLNYLHQFAECLKFNRLFTAWEKSNYNKQLKPSIDRISNKKCYSENNIQWLTWSENRFKQTMERRNRGGKIAQILNGRIIKIFLSERDVTIKTGLTQSSINMAINGKRKLCGGYEWKKITGIHENPELLNS